MSRTVIARVIETIRDELEARGWSEEELARKVGEYEYGIGHLSIDLLFALEDEPNAIVGKSTDDALCHVFGLSKGFFTRLEAGFKEQSEAGIE